MADSGSNLEILISAVDEASEAIQQVSESMSGMAEAAGAAAESVDTSLNSVGETAGATTGIIETANQAQAASFALAAEIATQSDQEIIDVMLQAGVDSGTAAAAIAQSNAEIAASSEETAAEVTASSDISKGSFMAVGVAAGIAFAAVASAVTGAISSAMQWDETSAVIQQELKDIDSSIPLSAMQAYAQQVQATTLFTQQQALASEAVIAGQANLAPQYQNLTMLAADLATKIQQFSGSATADLPSAMKILSNSLNDPVAGLSQLQRQAGVDIPAAMVTMIKNLANAGDTAGADKELIAAVTGQVGGLAQAAANAPGGGLIQLQNALTSLGTYIGNAIIPGLTALAKSIEPVITEIDNWVQEHPKLTEAILLGVVAFTALLAVLSVIGIIVAAVGSSVAFAAVVISAAIAGLIAVIVPNWHTFWTDFQDTVNVATTIVADIIIFFIELVEAAVYVFSSVITGTMNLLWDAVKLVTQTGINIIVTLIESSLNLVETIWTTGWGIVSTIVTDVWTTIGNTVKNGVNFVIEAINAFINALDSLHINIPAITIPGTKLGTPAIDLGFNIPDIPMLAAGGVVYNPVLAMIGEQGPEAVVPLSSLGGGGVGGGGQQIVVNINGGIFPADPSSIRQIGDLLAKQILQSVRVRNYQP